MSIRIIPNDVTVSNPHNGKTYAEGFDDGVAIMIGKSINIDEWELDALVKAWNKKQICTCHQRKDYCWHHDFNRNSFAVYFNKFVKSKMVAR
jgi:hypothetical protein